VPPLRDPRLGAAGPVDPIEAVTFGLEEIGHPDWKNTTSTAAIEHAEQAFADNRPRHRASPPDHVSGLIGWDRG
jgi:hypothetical protein